MNLSAEIKIRPTRIGFLVRPSDITSIRTIMRINVCLWGGLYNPIIPVCSKGIPKNWEKNRYGPQSGKEITEGYVRFFEPDVYVEAEEGLLEKSGLGAFREDIPFREHVSILSEFMSNEYRGINESTFGQNIFDILKKNYEIERRFVLRDEYPAFVSEGKGDTFAELCIGVYPDGKDTEYLSEAYEDVYKPELLKSNPETWLKLYKEGGVTPLRVTDTHLEKQRFWHNELTLYIIDPKQPIDLIDVWNARIEPSPILPIPMDWFVSVSDYLKNIITSNYRPLKGNPNGIMHHTNLQLSSSISEDQYKTVILPALKEVPNDSIHRKEKTPYWNAPFNSPNGPRYERLSVTCSESRVHLPVKEESGISTEFSTLSPDFAERYSGSKSRWANILMPSSYQYSDYEIATVLPHNTFDRSWPRLGLGGEKVSICREGWVFLQDFKDWEQPVYLMKNEDAFSQWFKKHDIIAKLSEPGNIAKQMLRSLKGFWGLCLINNPDSLHFINSLANKRKRYEQNNEAEDSTVDDNTEITEDEYDNKAASIKSWKAFLSKHLNNNPFPELTLSDYIERNIMKLGIETKCLHCGAKNWHKIDAADYTLECERCLKSYDFPQADLRNHNENWKYRVIGPFAVPNYAEGSYGALLTIKTLRDLSPGDKAISFSTAMHLESNGKKCEIDFAIWSASEPNHDTYGDPQLIIGEAKSFGDNIIKEKDISQLKIAAGMLPNSVLVISVLKDTFSDEEKVLLKDLVEWARESDNYRPKHWVILFTGTELFLKLNIKNAWKEKGAPHSKFADYHHTRSLSSLSDATINIYLGMPSYYNTLARKKRK